MKAHQRITATVSAADAIRARLLRLLLVTAWFLSPALASAQDFERADANTDGAVNVADPIFMLSYLGSGSHLPCLDAADANDDGNVDIVDPVFVLYLIFTPGSVVLPAPAGVCGPDTSMDALDCVDYPGCP